jgi:hypothetical protein
VSGLEVAKASGKPCRIRHSVRGYAVAAFGKGAVDYVVEAFLRRGSLSSRGCAKNARRACEPRRVAQRPDEAAGRAKKYCADHRFAGDDLRLLR